MSADRPVFYSGQDGTRCFGAPELPHRINPPLPIRLAEIIDTSGKKRFIVNCYRAKKGRGLCGPDGPACVFTPLALTNLAPEQRNVAVLLFENQQLRTQERDAQARIGNLQGTVGRQTAEIYRLQSELLQVKKEKPAIETLADSGRVDTKHSESSEQPIVTRRTKYGDVTLDTESHTFTVADREIPLSPIREQIMLLLLRNFGNMVSTDEIIEATEHLRLRGLTIGTVPKDTVYLDIRILRKQLGAEFANLIQTLRSGRAIYGFGIKDPEEK
jgi:DNA-binding response OmpR family regulator